MNKYKYKIITFFMIPMLLVGVSCEDQLNLQPTSIIGSSSFWNTQADVESYVNGMFQRLRNDTNDNLFFWGGSRGDLLGYGLQASENKERYFENSLDANFAGPDWKNLFTVIHDANLILKYAPDISFDTEERKQMALGQAHAMRAYCYFIMIRVWGDAPLVTEPTEGFDPVNSFVAKSPVTEVMAQVKADLTAAVGKYPSNDFVFGRSLWSRPAINALIGEVYLWSGKQMGGGTSDITIALAALESIKSADVSLLDNFDDIFRYDNKANEEIILSVNYLDLESGNQYNDGMYIRGDQIPADGDPVAVDLLGVGGGLNRWSPSEYFRSQWTDDDTRKDATWVLVNTADADGDYTVYYASAVLKYRGFVDAGARKYLDDVVLYRYGDVLLMIAEAKSALGEDPSAEMNLIRLRAYKENFAAHTFVNGSQAENDAAILQERLFETAFEGKRWFDLVRFDKEFELIPSMVGQPPHKTLFPIGNNTISLNYLIEQNPGY